jgi:MoaA/NifB/PqqE/SkfB family radical SAM enzyme
LVAELVKNLSALGGIRHMGKPPLHPTMIANFAITYRCNSRCRTCRIWEIEDPGRGELTLDEIRWIFASNLEFLRDIRYIQITGGETFMRPDLPEIISTIHGYLPECVFGAPTNGMEPERIERATEATIRALGGQGFGVSVSVDGLERTHDSIRGVDGSFERAVETLRRLSALRRVFPGLRLAVGMTLTPENHGELPEVFGLARRHGARFSFRPVNHSEIYYRNRAEDLWIGGVPEALLQSVRGVGRATVERYGFRGSATALRYIQGALDYIRDPSYRRLPCSAGSDSFFLDPYGNVYPCIFMDERMGNAREAPLEAIWRSPEASEARRKVKRGECPGCWVECEAFRDIHKDIKGLASAALRAFLHPSTAGIS